MGRPPTPPLLRISVQYVANAVNEPYVGGDSLERLMMFNAELIPVLRFLTAERRYSGTTGGQNSICRERGH